MALIHCAACGKTHEARQMTPCSVCGTLLCGGCSYRHEGACPGCLQEMENIHPTRLL